MFKSFLENPPKEIVKFPASILFAKTSPIEVNDEIREVAQKMFELMYQFKGVGLAAPQVGLPISMFIINPTCDPLRKDKELVFINPEIFHLGTRLSIQEEGCLSIPGVKVNVSRPHKIMFKALNLDGKEQKYCFEGFVGRICQHEYDHLEGVLITDKENRPTHRPV